MKNTFANKGIVKAQAQWRRYLQRDRYTSNKAHARKIALNTINPYHKGKFNQKGVNHNYAMTYVGFTN